MPVQRTTHGKIIHYNKYLINKVSGLATMAVYNTVSTHLNRGQNTILKEAGLLRLTLTPQQAEPCSAA